MIEQTPISLLSCDLRQTTPESICRYLQQLKNWLNQRFQAKADIYYLLNTHTHYVDTLLIALWQKHNLHLHGGFCLVATGGFGRSELFPNSDIDLLVIYKQAQPEIVEPFITHLWDTDLYPSHAVRTIEQCLDLATQHAETYTSLLDSRFIYGQHELLLQLREQLKRIKTRDYIDFFLREDMSLLLPHDQQQSHQLEPDIKSSRGGLRDLQSIRWVAQHKFHLTNWKMMLEHGILTESEFKEILNCEDFLYKLRFGLHLITNRKDNRLVFEVQPKLAQLMGFRGRRNAPVERMMKKYYQVAYRVSELNKLLLQVFSDKKAEQPPDISVLDENFIKVKNKIHAKRENLFRHDPSAILKLFIHIATHEELTGISTQTLRYLRESREQITRSLKGYPQSRADFIALLKHRRGIEPALRLMNQHGVLAAYFREWRFITGMMQFDMFHVFTVDEHTIHVLRYLSDFRRTRAGDPDSLEHEIAQRIRKPYLLLLAGLFHDIGKGRKIPHTIAGANMARTFCAQHNLRAHEQNLVAWLVENHLAMSTTVHKRDIHDPDVIQDFAQLVRDRQHLDYLYCLTVADIRATNPQLWNNWRQTLLRQLYYATLSVIYHGIEQPCDSFSLLQWVQQQALSMLTSLGYDENTVCVLWQSCHIDYFLHATPERLVWHTQHILDTHDQNQVVVLVSELDDHSGTEVFVYCPDSVGLLSRLIGVLERKNLLIQEAHISTSKQGLVFDSFVLLDHLKQVVSPTRYKDLQIDLQQTIISPQLQPRSHRLLYKTKPIFKVDTIITFLHNSTHREKTSFELITWDRPGLLAQICDVFLHLRCTLITARVTTLGARVDNLFVVTNSEGHSLDKKQQKTLVTALKESLESKLDHDT